VPTVSVVIPALDEESRVAAAIRSVAEASEAIVVDGGSVDRTREVARTAGARVIEAARGRGGQIDEGARIATGEWLVLLHADTRLEPGWSEALAALPAEVVGGAFRLAIDSPRRAFRLLESAVRLRVRLFALPYGDQALFVRREVYDRIGGMPHLPLMEDVAFVRRLRGAGRLAFLPVRAITSARRWERYGILGTTARNLCTLALYALGRPPARLERSYGAAAPARLDRPPERPL